MSNTYTVSIEIQVTDPCALHAEATRLVTHGPGGMSAGEAELWLGTPAAPKVETCLRSFFDRGVAPAGTEILDSSCA